MFRDESFKRFEDIKTISGQKFDVLENRIDAFSHYDEKISTLFEDMKKDKLVSNEFKNKMTTEIGNSNSKIAKLKSELS